MSKFKNGEFETFQIPFDYSWVIIIKVGLDGKVWFTDRDLYSVLGVYDNGNWSLLDYEDMGLDQHATVRCIEIASNGDVWVATTGGLAMYNGENWQSWTYGNAPVSMINHIISIAFDSEGAVWLGYFRDNCFYPNTQLGLTKVKKDEWITWWFESSGLPYPNITALAVDGYDNVWIGLEHGGVAVFNEDEVYVDLDEVVHLLPVSIDVFPNPTKSWLSITNNGENLLNEIEILNTSGKLINQIKMDQIQHNNIFVDNLPHGVYFVRIKTQKGYVVKKIVKN